MKVALAHDFLRHGGAEQVLMELHSMWPEAPVHVLLAEDRPEYDGWDVRTSWLQRWVSPRRYRWPLLLYPRVVDRMRIDPGIDLLISSSVSWMKSLSAPPGVPHMCYIHRPMMFAYDRQESFLAGYPAPLRPALRAAAERTRKWDQERADRPTRYVANSAYTAARVAELYGREASVVHPPVEVESFAAAGRASAPGEYLLTVVRLESYKRVDLAVRACSKLGLALKVAGAGPELAKLRELAGPSVEFLGFVPRADLPRLVAGARGFLFPAEEDFGIAPVESLAAGRPVIAFGAGGCLETVEHGVSGVLFPRQDLAAVEEALLSFDSMSWDAERIRGSALRFAPAEFRRRIQALADELTARG